MSLLIHGCYLPGKQCHTPEINICNTCRTSCGAPARGGRFAAFAAFWAACPENAFQRTVPGSPPISAIQRFGAVARCGFKLLVVGFLASLTGVSLANMCIALRGMLDPSWSPPNAPQVLWFITTQAAMLRHQPSPRHCLSLQVSSVLQTQSHQDRAANKANKSGPAQCL